MALGNKRLTILLLMLLACTGMLSAQNDNVLVADSIPSDSVFADSIGKEISVVIDTTKQVKVDDTKTKKWVPNPKRAMWLAMVIPGGGQIYNRKYWKLPIIYGGILGCLYAMSWNNTQYKDYSQAYIDITDDDPRTESYNKFLHLGTQITDAASKTRYTEIFRKRKDKYRRWRDLSFFVLVGVYALSVIDAYVDAELSVFDISRDLSLKVEPTIINNHSSKNPFDSSSVGLQCSLNF